MVATVRLSVFDGTGSDKVLAVCSLVVGFLVTGGPLIPYAP